MQGSCCLGTGNAFHKVTVDEAQGSTDISGYGTLIHSGYAQYQFPGLTIYPNTGTNTLYDFSGKAQFNNNTTHFAQTEWKDGSGEVNVGIYPGTAPGTGFYTNNLNLKQITTPATIPNGQLWNDGVDINFKVGGP